MNTHIVADPAPHPVITLVDDDPGVRRSVQLLLRSRGYDVRSYASSTAMLADAHVLDAACLVTDYLMPELDGIAVLDALRERGWKGPAILVSAYCSPRLLERAQRQGFASVMEKPLREHFLSETVSRLIGNGGRRPVPLP
ncbi:MULTISPECIES: response regulator transcription factor [Sphingobium]|uniref:Regulator n=3 Tax=Sphingobium TaxID=165695 RepID=T0HCY4_9SPHN|nr:MULTISPECIES: response regulator [Sphingobium]EQB10812.1 regulator [Sphingobium lactosutens DS20]QDC36549.1 response regulator [Sphingobium fuliginis ATCC 27551]